jgi:hypothetical protein
MCFHVKVNQHQEITSLFGSESLNESLGKHARDEHLNDPALG